MMFIDDSAEITKYVTFTKCKLILYDAASYVNIHSFYFVFDIYLILGRYTIEYI